MAGWWLRASAFCRGGGPQQANRDSFYLNGLWVPREKMDEGCCLSDASSQYTQLFTLCSGLENSAGNGAASHQISEAVGMFQCMHTLGFRLSALNRALVKLSESVRLRGLQMGQPYGATLIGLLWRHGHMRVFNIGDNRAYLLRGGKLHSLADDFSQTWQIKAGELITSARAETDDRLHASCRYLGMPGEALDEHQPFASPVKALAGDSYLLCSAGLAKGMSEMEIMDVTRKAESPETAVKALVEKAADRSAAALCVRIDRGRLHG